MALKVFSPRPGGSGHSLNANSVKQIEVICIRRLLSIQVTEWHTARLSQFDTDSGVHNPAALPWWQRKDRIQIQLSDLRNFFDEAGETQQHVFDRLHISCRVASVAL